MKHFWIEQLTFQKGVDEIFMITYINAFIKIKLVIFLTTTVWQVLI